MIPRNPCCSGQQVSGSKAAPRLTFPSPAERLSVARSDYDRDFGWVPDWLSDPPSPTPAAIRGAERLRQSWAPRSRSAARRRLFWRVYIWAFVTFLFLMGGFGFL